MQVSINNIVKWKSILVSVPCRTGQTEVGIGYQEYLKFKKIKAVYQTGNSVSINNQPVVTQDFWIDLKKGLDTYLILSANFLNWNNNNVIEIDFTNIDFQNSKIIFPTALVADVTVELIVFYQDTIENPS